MRRWSRCSSSSSSGSILRRGCRSRSTRSRSEEHTSELQSPYDLVCRLLLEKKNNDQSDLKVFYFINFITETDAILCSEWTYTVPDFYPGYSSSASINSYEVEYKKSRFSDSE